MIATTSRFAELARWQALLIVAILIAAMAGGVAYRMHCPVPPQRYQRKARRR
jgi:hypothetical protein